MKKIIVLMLFGFVLKLSALGQTSDSVFMGNVSFKNATNVYVRFLSTTKISVGDTLFIVSSGNYLPCLIVTAKSSISCVTTSIKDCEISLESQVIFRLPLSPKSIQKPLPIDPEKSKDTIVTIPKKPATDSLRIKKPGKQKITGRITAASYSSFSNIDNASRHSLTSRLSLNVDHLNNSNWALETYLNYRQNILDKPIPAGYQTKFFRIYNLALKYDAGKNFNISIGRKINNRIASVGAIDGVQSEYKIGKFFMGTVIGFRPDIFDYGFNSKLLQFGLFGGYSHSRDKKYFETTLGILEQRSGLATDRRYAYLQHTNRLNDKINMFSSLELDLYENLKGNAGTKPRLTSFYYSLNYQPFRTLSLMASYDSRRNIIYYESYEGNEIDRLLADDMNRQGFRIRINYKFTKKIYFGVSFGNRFQNDGNNKSDNIYGFITHNKLPWIGGSLNLNTNLNRSKYLESRVLAMRYSRAVFKQKLNFSTYYRIVDYVYLNQDIAGDYQQYIGADLSFSAGKNYSFSLMGEWSFREIEKNYRLNFSITKRIR